ncbi:MAG: hypothetical protein QN716_06550 [Nitrososphaeraceae archaeon]|jgi:hypothetical protein|nr:hypothetical protein [Nitrososphaeraceae archaeon]
MIIKLFGFIILMLTASYSLNQLNDYQEGRIKVAYGVTKSEFPCNCTLDSVERRVGFELPKVDVLQSKSELHLEWTESQEMGMDGILVGDTYLGNSSAGDLANLNIIKVEQNQLLGLEITGGALPDIVSAEILRPTTNMNRPDLKIGEIVVDKKVSDSFVFFNNSLNEPTIEQNSFRVETEPQGGDFILLVSLLYNYQPSNIRNGTASTTQTEPNSNFIAIYKSVLSVE